MKKHLGTYRGAEIYETKTVESAVDKLLSFKIWATGIHPHPKSLKIDFIQEGVHRYKTYSIEYLKQKLGGGIRLDAVSQQMSPHTLENPPLQYVLSVTTMILR